MDTLKKRMQDYIVKISTCALITLLYSGCSQPQQELVVYTSVDQIFSELLIEQFEKDTGIRVKAIYDTEAAKTVGLEKRLIAEKERPQADIFWNSEHLRTLRLKSAGILSNYKSNAFNSVPDGFKDQEGYWTGFGARYRVFVINHEMVDKDDFSKSLDVLTDNEWRGKAAVAKPYFGTTSTHFAALYARHNSEVYRQFLTGLKDNDVAFLSGNSHVRDAVVRGEYAFGLTDTDDVSVAIDRGDNVSMVFADNFEDGAYAIPHTVSMIAGGPNPENAKKFVDYLLSKKAIQLLVDIGAIHGSIRPDLGIKTKYPQPDKFWLEGSPAILEALGSSAELAREILDK